MLDYSIEIINDQDKLAGLIDNLASLSVIAVDIETINWWNRHQERISLIQIAFKTERKSKVAVIDSLADLDLEPLRYPLELNISKKWTMPIHNWSVAMNQFAIMFERRLPLEDFQGNSFTQNF